MTNNQILEAVSIYENFLNSLPIEHEPIRYTSDSEPLDCEQLDHILWMIQEIRKMLQSPNPNLGKINRWLGFIQGTFWSLGKFTIKEMRDHNK
jgi:hypothetical protein